MRVNFELPPVSLAFYQNGGKFFTGREWSHVPRVGDHVKLYHDVALRVTLVVWREGKNGGVSEVEIHVEDA